MNSSIPNAKADPAPNVDPAEIAKFTALAQSWWDPNGPSKPLHDLNPLRLQYVSRAVTLAGASVLDVGCGGGILSESMAHAGARVLGIDLSRAVLDVAELHALDAKAATEYRLIPVEELARERPAAFDLVTCMEMLEHVPDPAEHPGIGRIGKTRRRHHPLHAQSQSVGVRGGHRGGGIYRPRIAARHT